MARTGRYFLNPYLGQRRRDDIGLGFEQIGQAVQDYTGYRARLSEADRLEEEKYQRDVARRRAGATELADLVSPYLQDQTIEESVPAAGSSTAGVLRGEYDTRPDLAAVYTSQPRTVTRPAAENLADLLSRPELSQAQRATLLLPENVTLTGALTKGTRETRERKQGEAYGEVISKVATEAQAEVQRSGRYFAEVFPEKLMATVQAAPAADRLKIINAAMEMSQKGFPLQEKREARGALAEAQSYISGLIEAKIPRSEAVRRGLEKYGSRLSTETRTTLEKTFQPTEEETLEQKKREQKALLPGKITEAVETKKSVGPIETEQAVKRYEALTGPTVARGVAQITAETKARVAQLAAELNVRDAHDLQKRAVTAMAEADRAGGPEGIRDPLMRQLYESNQGLLRNLTRWPQDAIRDMLNEALGEEGAGGGKPPGEAKPKIAPALPSQGAAARPTPGAPAGAAKPVSEGAPSASTIPKVAPPPPRAAREQALSQFRQELRSTPDKGRQRAYVDRMVDLGYMSQREAEKLKAEFGLKD